MTKDWNTRTKLVHEGSRRSQYGEMAEAIFLTQGFVYPDAESAEARFITAGEDEFIYARYGNPTTRMFEERIASLEGTEDAFATASGMAAVSGVLMAMLRAGDHIVSSRALFGSCLYVLEEVLTRYGVRVTFVDGADLDQWRAAVTPGTKAVFFESMSNPTLELVDIKSVSAIAHAVGALVVVDNVFATPIFSKAVEQGADEDEAAEGEAEARGGVHLSDTPGGAVFGEEGEVFGVLSPRANGHGEAAGDTAGDTALGGVLAGVGLVDHAFPLIGEFGEGFSVFVRVG
jgi:O-succinylhomoserine sulfhydrylase